MSPQNGAARCRGGPLGGGGPLVPVGHGHPVLPLRRAEVGGGHGGGHAGKAPVDEHGGEAQPLPHGGAGPVETQEGDLCLPQAEGAADALVQEVPGADIVQLAGGEAALFQRLFQGFLLHGGLRLLPGLLPEEGVLVQNVEAASKGALLLEFPAHAGVGQHAGRVAERHGLGAHPLSWHHALPPIPVFPILSQTFGNIPGTDTGRRAGTVL